MNERKRKQIRLHVLSDEAHRLKKKANIDSVAILLIFITIAVCYLLSESYLPEHISSKLQVFNMVFISIIMQAIPFMLIGVLVSSAMHIFVPDRIITRLFPVKSGIGYISAMFAGFFLPVCECATLPIVTRLIKKGVALPVAVTFMLSAPLINPISIISTLYAFPGQPEIMLLRVVIGLFIAMTIGFVLSAFEGLKSVIKEQPDHDHSCCHDSEIDDEKHSHNGTHSHRKMNFTEKLGDLLAHSGKEFFSIGKYLIIGAFLTGIIQSFVPNAAFAGIIGQNWVSLLIMMLTAFLLSACSTSDAFIARSFADRFSLGAVMGFLIFGPMIDIKNLVMLLSGFRKSFVIKLSLIILLVNFSVLYVVILLIGSR